MAAHQVDAQRAGLRDQRARVRAPVQELPEKALLQGAAHLVLIKPVRQEGLFFVALDLRRDFPDHPHQLRGPHRLEQILIHPQGDGPLRILEVPVSADDDDLQPGHPLADEPDEAEPVQKRHAQVREEDVRHQLLHHGQGHLAV